MYSIKHYVDPQGKDPYGEWLEGLKDIKVQARISARVLRLQFGLFGDCRSVGSGVWELKVDWGPGYRIYYAIDDRKVVLLCEGGDKRTQQPDIKRAIRRWQDWQMRREK
jgi:putative addiction module killer protein